MTSYNLDLDEHSSEDVKYIGEQNDDGSWRILISGNNLNFERRESGTWNAKGSFTAV